MRRVQLVLAALTLVVTALAAFSGPAMAEHLERDYGPYYYGDDDRYYDEEYDEYEEALEEAYEDFEDAYDDYYDYRDDYDEDYYGYY